MITPSTIAEFRRDIGDVQSSTDPRLLQMKSRDYHWYSPVLTPQLQDCVADIVVTLVSEAEIAAVAAAAVRHRLPLTLRGGGTGNYGQAVPIQGGIVLDMTRFDKIVGFMGASLQVQTGAAVRSALDAALATGHQLMMFPSTLATATVGGYLGGGFAGIGSVRHGIIRDSGMIDV